MNKIVLHHVPARELPERLRPPGINSAATVTVTVQEEPGAGTPRDLLRKQLLEDRSKVGGAAVSTEEAVARIRALRDEWDDLGHFSRFKHLRRAHFASNAEIDDHIKALREEWDRR